MNDPSRDLEYFDDVELFFQLDKYQTFWMPNIITYSYLSYDTCGQYEAGD